MQKEIDACLKYFIDKWGSWIVLGILLIFVVFGIITNIFIKSRLEQTKTELLNAAQKNFEVWDIQKTLMFDFVDFLETKIFNNPNLNTEKPAVLEDLNRFYGKLYLILDTKILKNIHDLINLRVDITQRYYIYREIRKQLLSLLKGIDVGNEECPYNSVDIKKVIVLPGEEKPETIDDLKKIYPFIEQGDRPGTFRSLPFFKAEVLDFKPDRSGKGQTK